MVISRAGQGRGWESLLVLADLVADHAANGCAAHGTEHAATRDDRTGHAADARTGHGGFLTVAHVVPGGATSHGNHHEGGRSTLSECLDIHVVFSLLPLTSLIMVYL